MHPLLSQLDLVLLIFENLSDSIENEYPQSPGRSLLRRTLLSSALTCRIWTEPALDALWKLLDSLHPIFSLVDCFELVNDSLTLTGLVTDDDLQRCRLYNCRVRKLEYHGFNHTPIHLVAYMQLSRVLGTPLLPSLRVLTWSSRPRDIGLQLLTLITSHLVRVSVEIPGGPHREGTLYIFEQSVTPQHVLESFLRDLARLSPSLENLVLYEMFPGWSLTSLYSFSNLKSLTIDSADTPGANRVIISISYPDIAAFSRMENLTYLALNVANFHVPPNSNGVDFRSLRHLELTGPSSKIAAILALLRPHVLEKIFIQLGSGDVAIDYAAVLHNCAFSTLQDLHVLIPRGLHDDGLGGGAMLEAGHLMMPLRRCKGVKKFQIEFSAEPTDVVRMNDNDLLAIVQAWPDLTWFSWGFSWDPSCAPTVRGLQAFTSYCPHLEILLINVGADVSFPVTAELPASQHRLRLLDLGGDTPENAAQMMQWLRSLFPYLQRLSVPEEWKDMIEPNKWEGLYISYPMVPIPS